MAHRCCNSIQLGSPLSKRYYVGASGATATVSCGLKQWWDQSVGWRRGGGARKLGSPEKGHNLKFGVSSGIIKYKKYFSKTGTEMITILFCCYITKLCLLSAPAGTHPIYGRVVPPVGPLVLQRVQRIVYHTGRASNTGKRGNSQRSKQRHKLDLRRGAGPPGGRGGPRGSPCSGGGPPSQGLGARRQG